MRRPAPERLADISHPGPRCTDRRPYRLCNAEKISFVLPSGIPFLESIANWIELAGYDSAVLDLAGLTLAPFEYVMPDRAIDDRHAAWYSDTKHSVGTDLSEAVAIVGQRDGHWFAHIHAFWTENGGDHLGHLLPDTLIVGEESQITGFGISGAMFVARPDPETEFTLFRVAGSREEARNAPFNALITTLAPFEDLSRSIQGLGQTLGAASVKVAGLGSLAGAQFVDAQPMSGLVSEILLRTGCSVEPGGGMNLPVRCVDLNGQLHAGHLQAGAAPTLITCELLLIADP